MIRSVSKLTNDLSRYSCLLAVCVLVAESSHSIHAATPDVSKLLTEAKHGSVNQEIQLAEAYLTGNGVAQNSELATHWYEKAAQSGNPEAQNLVGQFYQAGIGVPADPVRAFHWYQLAAASGSPQALLHMGVSYAMGLGIKKDESLAAQYFREAADKGEGTGAAYLGILNYIGLGVRRDVVEAEHWFEVGAKLRDPISLYNLGILYSTVPDHAHDQAKATKFFRQASDTGYLPAIHALAVHLIKNPGFAKYSDEALNLAKTASEGGYWKASVLMGIFARDGIGMPTDCRTAYYSFKIATLQNPSKALKLLVTDMTRLSAKLGDEQTSRIDSEASVWFKNHHCIERFVHINGKRMLYIQNDPDFPEALRAGVTQPNPDA